MYKDKGAAANQSYKYLAPALSRTERCSQELELRPAAVQWLHRQHGAGLMSRDRRAPGRLAQPVTNANKAFGAIA